MRGPNGRTTRRMAKLLLAAALLAWGCDEGTEEPASGTATGGDAAQGGDTSETAGTETADTAGGESDGAAEGVVATFTSLYGDYFQECVDCHSPDGVGHTDDTEATLDFTSRETAYATISGTASGLVGNQEGCNGTPFLGATAAESLIYAVLDEDTRAAFDLPDHVDCNVDSISDETVKVGSEPTEEFMAALATWIDAGAADD